MFRQRYSYAMSGGRESLAGKHCANEIADSRQKLPTPYVLLNAPFFHFWRREQRVIDQPHRANPSGQDRDRRAIER